MFREFFRWWFGQLAELLPERWRAGGRSGGDAVVIGPAGPRCDSAEAVTVSLRRNGRETPLGRFPLAASGLSDIPRQTGKPTVLRIAETEVLGKTLSLPLAAERQLEQVLTFEMDRETPFKPDELFWTYRIDRRDRQLGQLFVRLLLLPRVRLERLLASLEHAGIVPRWAEIAAGPARGCRLALSAGGTQSNRGARPWLFWPAAACCALLALAAVATPFARQAAAISGTEGKI